jgi:formylmethanofuran--tetrahydromethanopterin N-formyltransferase
VGSKYPKLKASTNHAFCPTLRGLAESELPNGAHAAYEIVLDGLTRESITNAMRLAIQAACGPGIVRITAGNYGGKLGPHHLHLHKILAGDES